MGLITCPTTKYLNMKLKFCKYLALLILFFPLLLPSCVKVEKEKYNYMCFDCHGISDTKAVINSASDINVDGAMIGVSGGYSNVEDFLLPTKVFDNRVVTFASATGWTYENPEMWRSGYYYRFRAVYPYISNVSDDLTSTMTIPEFVVNADVDNQQDLLVSEIETKETVSQYPMDGEETIGFVFNHLLTNVNFSFVKASSNSDVSVKLQDIILYRVKDRGACTLTSEDGGSSWTTIWSTEDDQNFFMKSYGEDDGFLSTEEMTSVWDDGLLLIPQDVSNIGLYVGFNVIDNGVVIPKSAYISIPDDVWVTNTKVNYIATITLDYDIKFSKPEVEKWGSGEIGGVIIIK